MVYLNMEIYKDIKGYEGLYAVSNYGNVKSIERLIIRSDGRKRTIKEKIKEGTHNKGYKRIALVDKLGNSKSFYVHRIVAHNFIKESDLYVDHINGDKKDNILTGGWRVSQTNFGIRLTDKTSLKSLVYERVVDGKVTEYVYATAGSVEGRDWAENAKQPLGLSKQYHNAVENAKTLSKALSNTELNFVGHSLGGGEAALNSLVTSNEKLIGRKAFTFNAAGVGDITKIAEGSWKTRFKSEKNINAFILTTDPLNLLQNSNPIMPDVNGNRNYLLPKDLPSTYNGHSIDNIIKNFGVNPDEYKK